MSAELLRIAHGEDLAVHVDKHLRGELAGGTFSLETQVPVLAQDSFQCWLVVSLIDKLKSDLNCVFVKLCIPQ